MTQECGHSVVKFTNKVSVSVDPAVKRRSRTGAGPFCVCPFSRKGFRLDGVVEDPRVVRDLGVRVYVVWFPKGSRGAVK